MDAHLYLPVCAYCTDDTKMIYCSALPATELGRGITREEVPCTWCCGRGRFGAGGVLGSMMSVLGKASSCLAVRLSLVVPVWRSSLACPPAPVLPPRPSSFVKTSLEALRSSFSEELVMVAGMHKEKYAWGKAAKSWKLIHTSKDDHMASNCWLTSSYQLKLDQNKHYLQLQQDIFTQWIDYNKLFLSTQHS